MIIISIIKAKTADQKLMITSAPLISSGDKDVDFIEFDFDPTWDEFPERYCVFYLDRPDPYQVTIENDRCGIVQAMTEQEGTFCFGVWARSINGNKIKTSNVVEYRVATGAPTDGIIVSTWDNFWSKLSSGSSIFKGKKIEPNPPAFQTYNMKSAESMFHGSNVENIVISINKASSLRNFAAECTALKAVTFLDISNATTSLEGAFALCSKLERIYGEINAVNFSIRGFWNTFGGCTSLKEFRVKENTLSAGNVDMSASAVLSRESVLSLLAACGSTDTTLTMKFNAAVYSSDLDSYIMAAVAKGWTVAFGTTTFEPETEATA